MFKKISVIGSGSWGTAIACHIASIRASVKLYSLSLEAIDEINHYHTNSRYLANTPLPKNISATNDITDILDSEVIFIAVPSSSFADLLLQLKQHSVLNDTVFVIATKGIASDSLELLSDRFVRDFSNPFAFFSGPNFAKEVAMQKFTIGTIAANDINLARNLAVDLASDNFELSAIDDIITPQIAGIVKNMIAIQSGILIAAKAGDNARAALVTKALQEVAFISRALGGKIETMLSAAVVGDLVLTSYSQISRNTKFGIKFFESNFSQEFLASYPVLVEGISAARLMEAFLNKNNLDLDNVPVIKSILDLVCRYK